LISMGKNTSWTLSGKLDVVLGREVPVNVFGSTNAILEGIHQSISCCLLGIGHIEVIACIAWLSKVLFKRFIFQDWVLDIQRLETTEWNRVVVTGSSKWSWIEFQTGYQGADHIDVLPAWTGCKLVSHRGWACWLWP
jgi:hypothetical protein